MAFCKIWNARYNDWHFIAFLTIISIRLGMLTLNVVLPLMLLVDLSKSFATGCAALFYSVHTPKIMIIHLIDLMMQAPLGQNSQLPNYPLR